MVSDELVNLISCRCSPVIKMISENKIINLYKGLRQNIN